MPRPPGSSNMAAPQSDKPSDRLHFSLNVPFPSVREATIALRSLGADRQPRRSSTHHQLELHGTVLTARWSADIARTLRVAVNSFLEHLDLVLETMIMFSTEEPESEQGKGVDGDVGLARADGAPPNDGLTTHLKVDKRI
ncbi:L antigen family member 3-like [Stigmatopora argus]